MRFNQKKMVLGFLFLLLGASGVQAVVQAEGHGHSASKTENSHLLDPTHPTGLNLKRVVQQLKDERGGISVSNSLCTKIVNIGTNKDQILKKSEELALSLTSQPQKQGEKKNIINRLKHGPLKGGSKKDDKSGEINSQLAIIAGLIMINQKLEADVSRALGLTLDQVRKIPPSSSFVGGAGSIPRAKSESDVTRPAQVGRPPSSSSVVGVADGISRTQSESDVIRPVQDKKWQVGHIPTVQKKERGESQGQAAGVKSFPSSPQLNRSQ